MDKQYFMELAAKTALQTSTENIGGPFGCVIVKDGEIVACTSNSVLRDNDPTAHGEMNAIRQACKKLGTYDLKGCELYTTGYPCPMCLSAIIWANIDKVYYGCNCKDAEAIGFRDDFIYDYIKHMGDEEGNKELLHIEELGRDACLKLFESYQNLNKTIY